jgi:hypothetical protein
MGVQKSKIPDSWGNRETAANKSSKTARKRVKRDLNRDRSALVQHTDINAFTIYAQGSYKNYTNTRGSSDLDLVVQLRSPWKRNISELSDAERARYKNDHYTPDYRYDDGFRESVAQALRQFYRQSALKDPITNSGKAIDVSGRHNPLPIDVDVVPAQEYRIYHSYPKSGDPTYTEGMMFKPHSSSEWWVNFPKEHVKNSDAKHDNFRETVRIFKNARDTYNEQHLFSLDTPSYYIECLLYNVPDSVLKRSNYTERFDDVLAWLERDNVDLADFQQASEMEKLFGDQNTQWNVGDAENYISKMRSLFESR